MLVWIYVLRACVFCGEMGGMLDPLMAQVGVPTGDIINPTFVQIFCDP